MYFSRRPWKYHSARQGRLDWTCFTSLVEFYLVSRKTFLFYSILTFHKVFGGFFCTTENWSAYIFLFVLCCWIKHSTWHCRVAIQFEYCFSIIGLYIDIYGYGMLSMGFWLLSRRNSISIVWRNWIKLKLISSSYLPIV